MAEEQVAVKGEGRCNPSARITCTNNSQGQPKSSGIRISDATHPPNVKTGSRDDILSNNLQAIIKATTAHRVCDSRARSKC